LCFFSIMAFPITLIHPCGDLLRGLVFPVIV
jgi:hypothetical protein